MTIGQFLRLALSNLVQRIPYEDIHSADALIQICQGIFIARQKKELIKEEILYRRLIKIYRTPDLLIELTRRPLTEEEIANQKEADARQREQQRLLQGARNANGSPNDLTAQPVASSKAPSAITTPHRSRPATPLSRAPSNIGPIATVGSTNTHSAPSSATHSRSASMHTVSTPTQSMRRIAQPVQSSRATTMSTQPMTVLNTSAANSAKPVSVAIQSATVPSASNAGASVISAAGSISAPKLAATVNAANASIAPSAPTAAQFQPQTGSSSTPTISRQPSTQTIVPPPNISQQTQSSATRLQLPPPSGPASDPAPQQ